MKSNIQIILKRKENVVWSLMYICVTQRPVSISYVPHRQLG